MRAAIALLFTSAVTAFAASAPPFTIDTALAGIREKFPQAARVSDALPPGIRAWEDLTFARTERADLKLDLYRRNDRQKRPAVLIVHGGGWVAGDRTMERPLARHLAQRGWVAAPVSYRLGPDGRFPNAVHDLKSAVRWLRNHAAEHDIDAEHIGIIGGSAGGTLAAFVGATNVLAEFDGAVGETTGSSVVQAVVDLDGLATFLDNALITQSEGPPSPYYVYQHGTYRQARSTWVAASPIHYVRPESAPTLFIKSTTERPILPGRDEMAGRLKLMGVDARVIQFPDTPHVFWLFHPWFERVVEESDQFLQRHLTR